MKQLFLNDKLFNGTEEEFLEVKNFKEKQWYLNNNPHRIDGPAILYSCGSEFWYNNGIEHRDGGPAISFPDGSEWWYQNGKLHRIDGPAIIDIENDIQKWYLNGSNIDTRIRDMRYFFPFWCEIMTASRGRIDRGIKSFPREDLFALTV